MKEYQHKNKKKTQKIKKFLKQFCNARGIIVNQCIEKFESGLNYNRKRWNKLLEEVMENKIKTIVISNKDKFIRFGYEMKNQFKILYQFCMFLVVNYMD